MSSIPPSTRLSTAGWWVISGHPPGTLVQALFLGPHPFSLHHGFCPMYLFTASSLSISSCVQHNPRLGYLLSPQGELAALAKALGS